MSSTGADGLRRGFRERRTGRDAGPCPSAEAIWEAALGRAPVARAREILEHAAACPACATAWRLARECAEPQARRGWRNLPAASWAVGAAAAAILVAVGFLLLDPTTPPPGEVLYRSSPELAIRSLTDEAQALPRSAFVLRWAIRAEGASFRIRVMDENLELLASAEHLEAPEFVVPASALQALRSGDPVLWQVDALLPDGSRRRSPTFVARLE